MDRISISNQRLLNLVAERRKLHLDSPKALFPWRQTCTVRTLLVTDGILDFGLQTFVNVMIHDRRSYVHFELTLAHLRTDVSIDVAIGGALVALREAHPYPPDEPSRLNPEALEDELTREMKLISQLTAASRKAIKARFGALS